MGWYSCYKALKKNYCKNRKELNLKNPEAFLNANRTNHWREVCRAWEIAEKKIKKEEK